MKTSGNFTLPPSPPREASEAAVLTVSEQILRAEDDPKGGSLFSVTSEAEFFCVLCGEAASERFPGRDLAVSHLNIEHKVKSGVPVEHLLMKSEAASATASASRLECHICSEKVRATPVALERHLRNRNFNRRIRF